MEDKSYNEDWIIQHSEAGPDLKLFKVRFDRVENPRNSRRMRAVVLDSPDWVEIIAMTPEGEILVVIQHRLGVGHSTVEIPAGIIETGETVRQAAERELAEETGFSSSDWEYLGWVHANPAFMNNRCHTWLASEVVKLSDPQLDDGEDITVCKLSREEVKNEIKTGRMRNVFAISALARVLDLRGVMDVDSTSIDS